MKDKPPNMSMIDFSKMISQNVKDPNFKGNITERKNEDGSCNNFLHLMKKPKGKKIKYYETQSMNM